MPRVKRRGHSRRDEDQPVMQMSDAALRDELDIQQREVDRLHPSEETWGPFKRVCDLMHELSRRTVGIES